MSILATRCDEVTVLDGRRVPTWAVPSASRIGVTHLVRRLADDTIICTCERAQLARVPCRHMRLVQRLLIDGNGGGEDMSITATPPRTDDTTISAIEAALAQGDLSKLSAEDRTRYLLKVCQSLSLNPLTRPLQYIVLSNRLTLYATRDATDQLRKLHGVSVRIISRERIDDLYIVQAEAQDKTGRTDSSIGAVSIKGLAGEALANSLMRAESKAKRRVTLSLCGLGMLDESEVASVLTVENDARALGAGESAGRREQRPTPAPQPSAPAPGERPDFDSFWRTVRDQGFLPADIQSAAVSTWGKQVPHLSREQLAELRDAVAGARLVADAEGVWTITPIGEPAVEEAPSAE